MLSTSAVFATVLLLASSPLLAEVYRHVDEQGNVTFSDEPGKGAEEVKVRPVTTVTLPKPQDVQQPAEQSRKQGSPKAVYDSVGFTSPNNDEAFHSGSGNVEFRVTSSPALEPGHRYEITLDGQPVGQSSSSSIIVNNIYRGTHNAQVHIVDSNGLRIKSGQSIRFTVHRPSVLN